jgi:SAM-dependent methyltransferase
LNNYTQQYLWAVTHPLPEMQEYFAAENLLLQSFVGPEGSVLDIGCGNGRTLVALAPQVAYALGIDYDPELIKVARVNTQQLKNVRVLDGDFFKTHFDQQFMLTCATYNLLGSSEIDPIEGRQKLIKRMLSLTKHGGHAYCAVWSDIGIDFAERYYPHIGIQVEAIEHNNVRTDHGTFHRFSNAELFDLARQFPWPFRIIEVGSVMYGLVIYKV